MPNPENSNHGQSGPAVILMVATAAAAIHVVFRSMRVVGSILLQSDAGALRLDGTFLATMPLLGLVLPVVSIWAMGLLWKRLAGGAAKAARVRRVAEAYMLVGWLLVVAYVVTSPGFLSGFAGGHSGSSPEPSAAPVILLFIALCGAVGAGSYVAPHLAAPLPTRKVVLWCLVAGLLLPLGADYALQARASASAEATVRSGDALSQQAAYRLRDTDAGRKQLRSIGADPAAAPGVRALALQALWSNWNEEGVTDLAPPLLADPDPAIRARVASALPKATVSRDVLVAHGTDPHSAVRVVSTLAMSSYGGDYAFGTMLSLLADWHRLQPPLKWKVQECVLWIAALYGRSGPEVVKALETLRDDPASSAQLRETLEQVLAVARGNGYPPSSVTAFCDRSTYLSQAEP